MPLNDVELGGFAEGKVSPKVYDTISGIRISIKILQHFGIIGSLLKLPMAIRQHEGNKLEIRLTASTTSLSAIRDIAVGTVKRCIAVLGVTLLLGTGLGYLGARSCQSDLPKKEIIQKVEDKDAKDFQLQNP